MCRWKFSRKTWKSFANDKSEREKKGKNERKKWRVQCWAMGANVLFPHSACTRSHCTFCNMHSTFDIVMIVESIKTELFFVFVQEENNSNILRPIRIGNIKRNSNELACPLVTYAYSRHHYLQSTRASVTDTYFYIFSYIRIIAQQRNAVVLFS